MFKKYTKTLLDQELLPSEEMPHRLATPFTPREEAVDEDEPETTLGEKVAVKGYLAFERLLRIDGKFEGELVSNGKLVIGPTGTVKANLNNLEEAYIAGKVEGDIHVKQRLVLRGRAEVRGNITAPSISVDEGVTIIGQLTISTAKPDEPTPFIS